MATKFCNCGAEYESPFDQCSDCAGVAVNNTLIGAAVDAATTIRAATPGRPQDGPYPASQEELGAEVRRWLREAGFIVVATRDEATLKLIRRATFDPGAFVKHELHTDGLPDELHVWQSKAILAALADGEPS